MIVNFGTVVLYILGVLGISIALLAISSQLIKIANVIGIKIWRYNKLPIDKNFRIVQLVSFITVSIVVISYVANLGWLRTFLILPTMLSIVAFDYICKNFQYLKHEKKNLILSGLSVFFVISYLILPDFADAPNSTSVFFGTIVGSPVWGILLMSSFSVYTLFLILVFYTYRNLKKSKTTLTPVSTRQN